MNNQKSTKRYYVLWYSVLVLVFTWGISFALFTDPELDTNSIFVIIPIALAMFFPAILAFIFKRITYKNIKTKSQFSVKTLNKKSLLFAVFYPIVFILLCFVISLILNIGEINYKKIPNPSDAIQVILSIFINMILLVGEEYGWRGYLLPELTKDYGKIKATVIVGIVWGLFHVPVIYLSAKASGMSEPLIVCLIQAFVVFVFSFSYSYCYYLSENLIPILLMHSIWNELNTLVLGNISSNNQGILHGNLFYINGEGVLGLVLGFLLVFWFIVKFRKGEILKSQIKTESAI
jgi:membrane protease YdiL (CAAX protease family)